MLLYALCWVLFDVSLEVFCKVFGVWLMWVIPPYLPYFSHLLTPPHTFVRSLHPSHHPHITLTSPSHIRFTFGFRLILGIWDLLLTVLYLGLTVWDLGLATFAFSLVHLGKYLIPLRHTSFSVYNFLCCALLVYTYRPFVTPLVRYKTLSAVLYRFIPNIPFVLGFLSRGCRSWTPSIRPRLPFYGLGLLAI